MAVNQAPRPTPPYSGNGQFIEGERQRLAQEIHDGLIQELTGAVLQLEICEKKYDYIRITYNPGRCWPGFFIKLATPLDAVECVSKS